MIIHENHLISKNSRGKIQLVHIICEQNGNSYLIKRTTGQLGGKLTPQPVITIDTGKVKRSTLQQAELEYNSKMKSYLDKGYQKLADLTKSSFKDLSEKDLLELVNDEKEDTNGVPKPMLAVQSEKCSASTFNKPKYISRKLDGVRNALLLKDGEILSASRGGKNYDIATTLIRKDEKLKKWFEKNPDLILDGELYSHGVSLQKLSGIARLETWEDRCEILEYWIYDVYSKLPFTDRLEILEDLKEYLGENIKIKILPHKLVQDWQTIKKEHDIYVKEGYEGAVLRNPDKEYGVGKRSASYMIKIKDYLEAEFEITGISEGLRDEDMVFTLITKEGKPFEAKPVGPRELKYEYLENIDKLIGKMGTVKFFSFSDKGVPMQTTLKAIRDYE